MGFYALFFAFPISFLISLILIPLFEIITKKIYYEKINQFIETYNLVFTSTIILTIFISRIFEILF